jgi:hypothetical protein
MQDERCAQIDGVFGVRRALAAFRSLSLNENRRVKKLVSGKAYEYRQCQQ